MSRQRQLDILANAMTGASEAAKDVLTREMVRITREALQTPRQWCPVQLPGFIPDPVYTSGFMESDQLYTKRIFNDE